MSEGGTKTSCEFVCPLYHERLIYFLATDIFSPSELENNYFIEKYGLNARYRDYKLVNDQGFPGGYPLEKVKFNDDGYVFLISLRALHRICCKDLYTKTIHGMHDEYYKWKVLNYDNDHGSLIKFMIHDKKVPIMYLCDVVFKDEENNTTAIRLQVIRIESVWNLDGESGILIYYMNTVDNTIHSFYADRQTIMSFNIIF